MPDAEGGAAEVSIRIGKVIPAPGLSPEPPHFGVPIMGRPIVILPADEWEALHKKIDDLDRALRLALRDIERMGGKKRRRAA